MDNYFNRPEVSNSDLSRLKEDHIPAEIKAAAQRFGRLVDAIITEPALVDHRNCTMDGEQYSPDDFSIAHAMQQAFINDPMCASVLKQSTMQHVMIKHGLVINHDGFEFTLPVRCKWDLWMQRVFWGGDIKSTTATSQKQFEEAMRYFDYDRQRAFYMDIAGSNQDILIGISKRNFQVFKVPISRGDRNYNSGKAKYQELAHKYHQLYCQPKVSEPAY